MEKCSRSIVKIVVVLIYAYVETTRCSTLNITDPNVCPRKARSHTETGTRLILECCPNYLNQNGKCEACPAGTFGMDCLLTCFPNYHGVQCKKLCNCTDNKKCDPVHGCVCDTGFTGIKCSNACPSGRYGVNCSEDCFCAHDAECDPVTGSCLCSAGWFGLHCTKACPSGRYGVNCKEKCFCAHDAECDPVTGGCLCSAGWFGDHCTKECHQGYYDFNLNYNCSATCVCNDGAICNNHSGICECKDKTSCINIKKKQIPKDNTSTIYVNRKLFIVVVTLSVSIVCVLLLVLTYLLLRRYLKHRPNRSSQNDGNETHIVQGHYDDINHYSEIRDDQLHDTMRTSPGMIENDHLQYSFQRTTNREQEYQNNAQSLSNINMFEEQYHNSYCSLQHENEDYLNPYCALRFERRVNSCIF